MTIEDFFDFSEIEYARRIKDYTNERLIKQNVVKIRAGNSGLLSVGTGIGGAAFSFGGTLAISAYGARRMYVAEKKTKLIEAELRSRGIEPHAESKRDMLIPMVGSLLGLGIGCGVDIGLNDLMAAPVQGAIMVPVPSGKSAVETITSNPSVALDGVEHGISTQVAVTFADVTHGSAAAVAMHAHHLMPIGEMTGAEALGEVKGTAMATLAEKSAIAMAGQTAASELLTETLGDKKTEKVMCM